MKKYFLFCSFCCCVLLSIAQSDAEKNIRQTLETQSAAWNKGDLDAFMKPYWNNDSLMFIGQSGVTYGWKNTLTNYQKNYPNADAMGILKFDIIDVTKISNEYYSVVGKWTLLRKIGDVSGHFTLLWKKINGRWVIVQDHSS